VHAKLLNACAFVIFYPFPQKPPGRTVFAPNLAQCSMVMKFEEINLKFKKVRKSSRCNKVRKSSKSSRFIVSHKLLLSKDTQYCQHCNNVKLRAVQCTSTGFLINAHFNNKGYTSIRKRLQKLEFLKIFAVKHAIIYFLTF